jgi:hypothetical protein
MTTLILFSENIVKKVRIKTHVCSVNVFLTDLYYYYLILNIDKVFNVQNASEYLNVHARIFIVTI